MSTLLKIAWRNVWRQRRRTILIILAMGVTMALLVFYDGLLTGFEQAIYGNAIQLMGGNIQVHAPGYNAKPGQTPLLPLADPETVIQTARAQPNVVQVAPRINTSGLATNREGAFSVSIVGLDAEAEAPHSMIAQNINVGRFLENTDGDQVVIGQGLATSMEITVGDRITLTGRATHEQMRQRTMTVVGIYDVNMPSIEKRTVYISLDEAQQLYGLTDQVTEIVVSLQQIGQELSVVDAISAQLPGYEIDTWETSIPELRDTLAMKNAVMGMFGIIMLSIAAIGILNLLLMAIFERTREIGILGALGLKPRQIMFLFVAEGTLIGIVGAFFGILLGVLINGIVGYYGIDYSQFSDLTEYTALISGRVYTTIVIGKILQRALTVAVIAALATIYPAREAARREPAEALHYV